MNVTERHREILTEFDSGRDYKASKRGAEEQGGNLRIEDGAEQWVREQGQQA
jgi:hypothetical protein